MRHWEIFAVCPVQTLTLRVFYEWELMPYPPRAGKVVPED